MSAFMQLSLVKTATFFRHTSVLLSFLITRSFYLDQRFPLLTLIAWHAVTDIATFFCTIRSALYIVNGYVVF